MAIFPLVAMKAFHRQREVVRGVQQQPRNFPFGEKPLLIDSLLNCYETESKSDLNIIFLLILATLFLRTRLFL